MKDTIKAKDGYWIGKNDMLRYNHGENARVLLDGMEVVMLCEIKSLQEYQDNKDGNECFREREVFTTRNGKQYIYWRDEELDENYITLIASE